MNASPARCFPALAVLLAVLAFPSLAADPPKCKLVRIAEWPVRLQRGLPIIEGSINGKKIGVLLDTGAYASLVTKAAAEKLDLATRSTSEWMFGVGGESRVFTTRIEELRIAEAVRTGMRVRVGGERPIPGVDFILGDDFFKGIDIEFDYAKGVVRLFQPMDCKGVSLAYWDKDALQVPMEDESKIVVPIKVNGRAGRALLDSGASGSVVSLAFAAKVGITPETPGVVSSECSSGIGADFVRSWVARFDAVALGDETVRDPRLNISEIFSEFSYGRNAHPEVILGTDFLRSHRVFVARSQGKVYFSYAGGLIFPATPALDCDDRLRGKDVKEALAAYDQAIAKNPDDAKALLNRAALRLRDRDANGALSDLDTVIRIEPDNAVALSARAGARAALKDYDGALADADAAIANGMRNAQMYVYRGGLRRSQGDYRRAIEELDEALKLDPRHREALRGRGRYLFHAGRFEAAENDFATLSAIRSDGFDAIWLSLSRARRGLENRAVLEQGVAKLKDGEWPAPIMLYLLGRLDREALIAAAASADESKRKGQECEARFYLAQHYIATGRSKDVRPLLEKARDECPRNFIEYDSALIDLTNPQ
jgi:predicted aspartyl protease/tetratricopeptide (TPR) repeat protein